jgi:transposase-like protein
MTRTEDRTARSAIRDILLSNPDGLRAVIRAAMQAVPAAGMEEAPGASEGGRRPERPGYRSGYDGWPIARAARPGGTSSLP